MSAKTFEKIENLVVQINTLHDKVKSGNASIEDINAFQETINKLYERATWLKYKSIESKISVKEDELPSKLVVSEEELATFDEERTKEIVEDPAPISSDDKPQQTERPAIDFSAAFSDRKEEPKAANVFNEDKVKPESAPEMPKEPEPETQTSLLDAIGTDDQSINDALMEDDDNSLASKMQKSPITDITTAIGMNDRFSFINELFQEDGAAYNTAVDHLNDLNNKVQAKEKLSEYAIEYSWDLESKSVRTFVELVERRYS